MTRGIVKKINVLFYSFFFVSSRKRCNFLDENLKKEINDAIRSANYYKYDGMLIKFHHECNDGNDNDNDNDDDDDDDDELNKFH